ncbi:hypothetical protein [Methylohalobius crimeensis]|uniref:hypothetical protein n=1 Tax=Methylohalobius crimeensis TaxID=244365 RepID=UPI0003B47A73|nr:hypothetical protein [Methylohalobius crimeensis]
MKKIRDRIRQAIDESGDKVFLRREFDRFGSRSGVNATLRKMIDEGELVRVGYGLYVPAEMGERGAYPKFFIEDFAPRALEKLGVEFRLGRAWRRYNSGESTQVPVRLILDVGRRRITRRIGFKNSVLLYEYDGR